MIIFLNGRKMLTRESAHAHLKQRLRFPDWYGKNLDALHDMLTAGYHGTITLKHADAMTKALGEYGETMLRVFYDSARESENFVFTAQK